MPNNLHFSRIGAAKPNQPDIVMLHGFLGQAQDWLPLLQAYCSDYSFVLVDLPGHGTSPDLKRGGNGFAEFDQLLQRTLHEAGVTSYQLYGYSLGGRLAMYHAAQQPVGLQRLMLESCHPGLHSSRLKLKRSVWENRWHRRILALPTLSWLDAWYRQPVFASLTPAQRQHQIQRRLHQPRVTGWALSVRQWSLRKQDNFWPMLHAALISTHFLVGALDPNYVKIGRFIRRAHWRVNLHISQKAGHNIHATAPQDWHRQFSQWLKLGLFHD